MLGSANFTAGPLMRFMSGNLSHQIEHHMYPDLPSNRYEEIGVQVRLLCEKYDLPYTTGSILRQYALTFRTILKLSLPNSMLKATSDDARKRRRNCGSTFWRVCRSSSASIRTPENGRTAHGAESTQNGTGTTGLTRIDTGSRCLEEEAGTPKGGPVTGPPFGGCEGQYPALGAGSLGQAAVYPVSGWLR